jgi:high-affinity nickel-transport protein
MDASLATALGLGLLLGLRHALDADHIAAVSTLVARERGLARSCLLGAFWGAGHTLALLGAGGAVIAFKLTITPGLEDALERMVGVVLVLLGGHVLLRGLGGLLVQGREHTHDGIAHRHPHLRLGSPDDVKPMPGMPSGPATQRYLAADRSATVRNHRYPQSYALAA